MSLAVLGAAVGLVASDGSWFARAGTQLGQVDGRWVAVAVAAEAGSMVALARLQQRLLAAGGSHLRLRTMVAITTAGNAVTGTLPGGVAWAAAWLYDQLGRRAVPRALRVWSFLAAGAVSSFALFVLVATGVETAGSAGPVASLRLLAVLLACIPVAVAGGAALARLTPARRALTVVRAGAESRVPGGRRALTVVRALVGRLTAVHLDRRQWAIVFLLALANWLLDCLVVVASLEALGVGVPWGAILVVYGLTQVSASLPLTPGGIGVVAGSMAALLHAYGVPLISALAVVLLYRIVSFWGLVPVGWTAWAVLDLAGRRRPASVPPDNSPAHPPDNSPAHPPDNSPAHPPDNSPAGRAAVPGGTGPALAVAGRRTGPERRWP